MNRIATILIAAVLTGSAIVFAGLPQTKHEFSFKIGSTTHSFPAELISGTPIGTTSGGRRMHKPLVFVKRIDKSSPSLKRTLDSKSKTAGLTLKEYQRGSNGKWIFSRRCLMRGLRISRIVMSEDRKFETITCTFEEITIESRN